MVTVQSDHSLAELDVLYDRYIAWPGQALAYKIGQLKISEIRAQAERVLGHRFDLRQFHDRLLGSGALPLDILENEMRTWLESKDPKVPL